MKFQYPQIIMVVKYKYLRLKIIYIGSPFNEIDHIVNMGSHRGKVGNTNRKDS